MHRRRGWVFTGIIVLLATVCFQSSALGKPPKLSRAGQETAPPAAAKLLENATPEQVDAFLAGLSDEQARRLLSERLKRDAEALATSGAPEAATGRTSDIAAFFKNAEDSAGVLLRKLRAVFTGAETAPSGWPEAWAKLTGGKGFGQFAATAAILLLIVLAGLAAERFLLRRIAGMQDYFVKTVPLGRLQKIGFIVSNLLIEVLGLAGFAAVTFVLFVFIYDPRDSGHLLVFNFLVVIYYFRLVMFAGRAILAPKAAGLRLAPMSDADAALIYAWMMRIAAVCALIAAIALTLKAAGISSDVSLLILSSAGMAVSVMLITLILQSRERVARAIATPAEDAATPASAVRAKLAGIWPGASGCCAC